jgi:hypothetical protein
VFASRRRCFSNACELSHQRFHCFLQLLYAVQWSRLCEIPRFRCAPVAIKQRPAVSRRAALYRPAGPSIPDRYQLWNMIGT